MSRDWLPKGALLPRPWKSHKVWLEKWSNPAASTRTRFRLCFAAGIDPAESFVCPLLSPNGKVGGDFGIATLCKDFARLASSLTAKVRAAVKYGGKHRPARM
jgi:hypothetical protein